MLINPAGITGRVRHGWGMIDWLILSVRELI